MCPAKKPATLRREKFSRKRSEEAQIRRIKALFNMAATKWRGQKRMEMIANEARKSAITLAARSAGISEEKIPAIIGLREKWERAHREKDPGMEEHYGTRFLNFLSEECALNTGQMLNFVKDFENLYANSLESAKNRFMKEPI